MPPRTSRRRKAMGQHFLSDVRVADRHVAFAQVTAQDHVLEIGPGTGVLTRRLAPRAGRLVAVEKDPALVKTLRHEFSGLPNVEIVEADATEVDLAGLGPFHKIVANLPYSVSTPITFLLLPLSWSEAHLMYQKEFADRLVAEVGRRDYGRLSAARAYFATAELLETVPRGAFSPPPKVASAIVRLRRHRRPPFEVSDPAHYLDLLRILFSTRRKTIRSTAMHQRTPLGFQDARPLEAAIKEWGRGDARPEEVAPADFARLTFLLEEARGHA